MSDSATKAAQLVPGPARDRLPSGWEWLPVQDLATDEPGALTDGPFGSNLKTSHYTESGPRVIRLQNIGDGVFHDDRAHISQAHFERLRRHEAVAGDVVVAMLGETLPRASVVPSYVGPAIVKADCARLRVDPDLALSALVASGLNSHSLRRQADELVHGVGRPRLGLKWLKTLRFPVPPLPEQRRIVTALDSYFTRLDDAVETLERAQRNLKRYRASVLKAAVEGRLVPTEAQLARAEGRDYEPASVFLERILAERRRRWETSGRKGRYKEPAAPDTTDLPELPEGWCWATAEALSDASRPITYGVIKLGAHVPGGIPVLRSSNVRHLRLDLEYVKPISERIEKEFVRTRLIGNEVLITVRGTLGGVAVVSSACRGFNITREVAMIALVDERLGPAVATLIASPLLQAWMLRRTKGITYQGVNIETLKMLPIPLPPLPEQARLASQVARCLSVADETQLDANRDATRCTHLQQSILNWAFEGRLADQDPNDEPASVLLARIKAEREARAAEKPKASRSIRGTRTGEKRPA